jgi:1,4-alpha-glucan branching enzyme
MKKGNHRNEDRDSRREPQPTAPVHFELQDPSARKVCIAGSFNDWRPEATQMTSLGNGRWVKDLTLPPGTYEYRLVVDGRWIPDPKSPHTIPNPYGEPNSLLTVAASGRSQARQPEPEHAPV